jgi:hypothetical protein
MYDIRFLSQFTNNSVSSIQALTNRCTENRDYAVSSISIMDACILKNCTCHGSHHQSSALSTILLVAMVTDAVFTNMSDHIQSKQLNCLRLFQTFKAFQRRRKSSRTGIQIHSSSDILNDKWHSCTSTQACQTGIYRALPNSTCMFLQTLLLLNLRVTNALLPLRYILLKTKETGFSETSYSIFFITTAARASYFVRQSFNQEGNY